MKKKMKIALGVLAALLLVLCLSGVFVVKHYLNKVDRIEHEEIEVVAPENEDFETDGSGEDEPVEEDRVGKAPSLHDEDLIHILLVGQDTRSGKRARSDSMILCSLNPDTRQVAMISFLRDLYVQLPEGYSNNRLNAAYAFGGFPMLYEVLNTNFGLTIDGGIEVDFEGFKDIIDLLGGVDISLTQAEAEWMGLSAGMQHMDGETALNYSRIRKLDSDFGRTERQRNVLTALFNKFRQSDIKTVMDLVNQVLGMVRTDLTDGEILRLAGQVAPMLSQLELTTHHVPADDAYHGARRNGMSVLIPDMDKIHDDLLNEYLPFSPDQKH